MVQTWSEFNRSVEERLKLELLGIETRPVVAHCQAGNHPIYASCISSDNETHVMIKGKPMCFFHRDGMLGREIEAHPIGRCSPHGC